MKRAKRGGKAPVPGGGQSDPRGYKLKVSPLHSLSPKFQITLFNGSIISFNGSSRDKLNGASTVYFQL